MLYNLILMLQRVRRYDEALEVLRHAVTLRHSTDLYASFRIWAAFEEALRGNKEAAQQQLAILPTEMITDARRPLHTMTELLLDVHLGRGDRKQLLKAIKERLGQAFAGWHPCSAEPYTKHGYLRFIDVVCHHLRATRLWIWGRWFYRGDRWLLVPALVILLPLAIAAPPIGILLMAVAFYRLRSR
jgi:hypothetical protein